MAMIFTSPSVASQKIYLSIGLRVGAYVHEATPCGQASNATLMWYDGRYFSAGRLPNVAPRPAKGGGWTGSYRNPEDGTRETVSIVLRGPTRFTWRSRWGRFAYRFCPNPSLPGMWRGMTPREYVE
ncbi:hypothetical protein [Sphingomonas sp.]|uniref:hypothetical protein n=1 Tax=Sphingomonas sp. TaxID=28214 RepID=UPI001B1D9738|nr:hypothetical protein [Sphingomonas sp.]MBO9714250.1 hypothetical protein [Sphingomonas sp.]